MSDRRNIVKGRVENGRWKREKARVRIGKNVAEGDDETEEEGRILTGMHGRYLGDIPLAHVAVKLVGAAEHCEEREGACQDEKNVAEGDDETAGEGMNTYWTPC